MPIIAKCPNPSCSKEIAIAEESLGKKLKCPFCHRQFVAREATGTRPLPKVSGGPVSEEKRPTRRRARPSRRQTRRRAARPSPREEPTSADSRRPSFFNTQTAQVIRIASLTLVIIAVLAGSVALLRHFVATGKAVGPRELFSVVTAAVENEDKKLLWDLMTQQDRRVAEKNETILKEFLAELVEEPTSSFREVGPRAALIRCLRTPEFQVSSWKYVRTISDGKAGEILFDDHTGQTRSIRIARMTAGWRLAVAEFCLKRMRDRAAAEVILQSEEEKPAPEPG